MTPTPTLTDERVDDVPVLVHLLTAVLGLHTLFDQFWPRHGNWQGLSAGQVLVIWLAHILSECTHTMSPVQAWASHLGHTLAHLLGQPLRDTDFSDDRLAEILRVLSLDPVWLPLERASAQGMIRVYRLPRDRVRLDSTTASIHSANDLAVLFQRGHSKDHRPDLPQLKALFAALDPLGALLAVDVVPGQRADDGLYVPMIERLRTIVGATGLLYIGDSKMSALATRAYVHATQNDYLTRLALVGTVPTLLADWITAALEHPVRLQPLYDVDGQSLLGHGYELRRRQVAAAATGPVEWTERVFVVRSEQFGQAARRAFRQRLARAQAAVEALTPPRGRGRQQYTERALLQEAVQALLTQFEIEDGWLTLQLHRETVQRTVRAYQGRPARVEKTHRFMVKVQPNAAAIEQHEQRLGWRVYVTNAARSRLTLSEALQAYRDEWLVERQISRVKGRPLSLAPLWVTREDHAVGLVRLLTLAARLLALAEYDVRQKLHKAQAALPGLYPEQPNRTTDQPTTERLLQAFKHLTLTIIQKGNRLERFITPLSKLQQRVLKLLGCPSTLYANLILDSG